MGSVWHKFGIGVVSVWGWFGIGFESVWDWFEIGSGNFGITLGSLWGHSGMTFGLVPTFDFCSKSIANHSPTLSYQNYKKMHAAVLPYLDF